jgi:hypothetical protein
MTKEELRMCFDLSFEELNSDLSDCGIETEKNDYNEQEKQLIKQYRKFIAPFEERKDRYQQALLSRGEKTHQEVLEEFLLFNEIDLEENTDSDKDISSDDSQPTPKKSLRKKKKPTSLFDLLKEGQKKTDKPITLSRSIELLGACGLPEKSEYSPEEVEKFLETCDLIINQGHSLGEVATQNGVTGTSPYAWMGGMALDDASRSAMGMAHEGKKLDSQMAQMYKQAYLKRIQEMFENGEFQEAYQLERERLRTEPGSTVDVFDLQYQAAMNQLHQGNLKSIQQINSVPQLPPED